MTLLTQDEKHLRRGRLEDELETVIEPRIKQLRAELRGVIEKFEGAAQQAKLILSENEQVSGMEAGVAKREAEEVVSAANRYQAISAELEDLRVRQYKIGTEIIQLKG